MERLARGIALLFVVFFFAASAASSSAAFPLCPNSDNATAGFCPDKTVPFHRYRFGDDFFNTLRYRDLEFHWDAMRDPVLTDSIRLTLRQYAGHLVDSIGHNALGYPMSRIELIYDYFHRPDFPSDYSLDARDTTAMVFGDSTYVQASLGGCPDVVPYKPSDRCHVDIYLADNSRSLSSAVGALGIYYSPFQSIDEDASDGRSVHGDIRHANSLAIRLPANNDRFDLDGTGWTSPESFRNTGFFHEFQHGLKGGPYGQLGEQMSALAEVAIGTVDTTTEVPYTWSLLAYTPTTSNPCANLRGHGNNYLGRTSFAGYLLYNFRGADISRTHSDMQDDLAHQWVMTARPGPQAESPGPLWELRNLLRDETCHDCARLLDPPGQTLSDTARLALLHHYWRAASYVNSPTLAQGQYGYPAQYGFSPGCNLKAWQAFDACTTNNVVTLPQEVTLGPADLTHEVLRQGTRSRDGASVPMVLQPYGAEYWIIRSDPALAGQALELVIRVWSDSLARVDKWTLNQTVKPQDFIYRTFDGRLVASAVGYSEQYEDLWRHPEWASVAVSPKWTDTDSLGTVLEFVVPDFGSGVKAVLLPITMSDAHQGFTDAFLDRESPPLFPNDELITYRVALALRRTSATLVNPRAVASGVSPALSNPTYSPAGDQVAYTRGTVTTRICLSPTNSTGPYSEMGGQVFGGGQKQADWSPRGDCIVYQTWHRDPGTCLRFEPEPVLAPFPAVHVFNLTTGVEQELTDGVDGEDSWPAFSPNGQHVAYIRRLAGPGGLADSSWQLRRVRCDGGNDEMLLESGSSAELAHPRWSPDGRFIYFLKGGSLFATDGQGTVFARAGVAPNATDFDLSRSGGPLLMEERAAATWRQQSEDTLARVLEPFRRVSLRDTTSGLNTPSRYVTGAEYFAPRWSFDGTRVVYSTNESHVGGGDIYVQQVSYNRAPTFTILPRDTVLASTCGRSLAVTLGASDPDGETLAWEAAYLPPGATLSSQGQLSWPNPPAGSEYFTVIRVLDASGGVAQKVVRLAVAADSAPPAAASDLEVGNIGKHSMTLLWSDVGDDGLTGTACRVRVAYSTQSIADDSTFFSLDTLATSAPGPSGTPECAETSELSECQTYYFGLKTQDDAGHWSGLSTTSAKTRCTGTLETQCNGGDLMAQAGSGDSWALESTVLDQSGISEAVTDVRPLRRLQAHDGEARLRLSAPGGGWTLDAVSLTAVDHAPNQQAFLRGSHVLLGTLSAADRASDASDMNLAAALAGGDEAVTATADSRWDIDLGDSGTPWLFLEAAGGDAHSADADSGITVQRLSRSGQWLTIGSVAPRPGFTPVVVDSIRGGHVRLIFNREYLVRRLGRFAVSSVAAGQQLTQRGAEHSRLGSVSAALGSIGGTEVVLRARENVVLRFQAPEPDSGTVRQYFLTARGQRATSAQLTRTQVVESTAEVQPVAFALHQSEPNPFRHTTRIRFDLPRPSSVRLEIFDLQGRRVTTLADGFFAAGYHSLEWDGRATGSNHVQAGVYAYRLQAGSFRAQRKLVLVP